MRGKRRIALLLALALLLVPAVSARAEEYNVDLAYAERFAAVLDEHGFAHGEPALVDGAWTLAVTCAGGPHGELTSDWYFIGGAVHARLRELISFDPRESATVLAALNDLNYDWFLVRYVADFSDNTVLVAADACLSDTDAEVICADLLDSLLQRAEDGYSTLRHFDLLRGDWIATPGTAGLGSAPGSEADVRANARSFLDWLDEEAIDATDYGVYDGQYVVEAVYPVEDGEDIVSMWIFDGRYVIGEVWELSSYRAADYRALLETVNEMNLTNGTLKFLADGTDNSVTAECYQLLPDGSAGELLRALYPRLVGLVLHEITESERSNG